MKVTSVKGQIQYVPSIHNICAVIVTYHPGIGFLERVKCINHQVGKVVIVDNHSSESCLQMIRKLSIEIGVHLILNKDNLGVATALNQGVRYAVDHGYTWVLTMDQDTLAYPTMVQNLITAYNDCPFREKVGMIGSSYHEGNTGKVMPVGKDNGKRPWLEVRGVITSGSLIPVPIFEKVGPFREDFFIDLIDTEYCHRLRLAGYKLIITPRISMQHFIGNRSKTRNLSANTIMPLNYPPFRSYYITRNMLLLACKSDFWKEPRWALGMLRFLIRYWLMTVLFEDNKLTKIKHIGLGITHGLISKRGKLRCASH